MTKAGALPGSARVMTVDVMRGLAVLAMCVSHMGELIQPRFATAGGLMRTLGLIATPAFLLMSGVTTGYVLRPDAGLLERARIRDRALFLLIAAHFVIGSAHVFDHPANWKLAFASFYITDSVALALWLATLLRGVSGRTLMLAGALLCVVSWPLSLFWLPESSLGRVVERALFTSGYRRLGEAPASLYVGYSVPLVPYLGLFLLGFGFSRHFRARLVAVDRARFARRLGGLALGLIGIAVCLKAGSLLLSEGSSPATQTLLWMIADPRTKFPPGPSYVLFFGGLTILCASVVLLLERHRFGQRVPLSLLATIGKATLMTYLLQEVLIYLLPRLFGWQHHGSLVLWLAYLAAVIVTVSLAARYWVRIRGNRFITVGYLRFVRWRLSAEALSAASNTRS